MANATTFLLALLLCIGSTANSQVQTQSIPDSLLEYEQEAFYIQLKEHHFWGNTELRSAADERLINFPEIKALFEAGTIDGIRQEFEVLGKKDEALGRIYRVHLTNESQMNVVIAQLSGASNLQFVEKIPVYRTFFIPNDPAYSDAQKKWHLNQIHAAEAWEITQGCAGVTIAIVDDAVLLTHEDLAPNIYVNPGEIPNNGIDDDLNGYIDDVSGYDVADGDPNANPPSTASSTFFTHGTLVAGAAAAQSNNSLGTASIGFNTSIIPVKTKSDGENTPGLLTNPIQGVEYAIASGADVINMSWGSYASSQAHQLLFNNAFSAGQVCVAATGNQGMNFLMYPAAYENVIAVAASGQTNDGAPFSNVTTGVTVFAPGVDIWSCLADANNSYGYASGTSLAAPIVSGTAALMICNDPDFTPEGIRNCIANSADVYPSTIYQGLNIRILNAEAAVSCAIPFDNVCVREGCELIPNGGFEEPSNSSITVYGNFGWAAVAEEQVCSWSSYLGTVDAFPNPLAEFDNYAGLYFSNYVGDNTNWPSYTESLVSAELELVAGQSYTLEFDASMLAYDYELVFDSLFVGLISNDFYYDEMASPPDTFATVHLGAVYGIPTDTLLSSVDDQPRIMDGTIQMSDFFRHYTLTFTVPVVADMSRLVFTPCPSISTYGYHQLFLDNISLRANLSITAITDQDTITEGDCVNLSATGTGNQFVWEPEVFFTNPVGASQVSCPDTSVLYIATVYDPVTGCTTSDSVNVHVIPDPDLAVSEQLSSSITTYPNPVTDEVSITVSGISGELQFEMLDVRGRKVGEGTLFPNHTTVISMKNLAAGVYSIRMNNGEQVQVIKQ